MPCVRVREPSILCRIQFDRIRLEGNIITNFLWSNWSRWRTHVISNYHYCCRSPLKRFNLTRWDRARKSEYVNGWNAFALEPNSRTTEFRINSKIYGDAFCENVLCLHSMSSINFPLFRPPFVCAIWTTSWVVTFEYSTRVQRLSMVNVLQCIWARRRYTPFEFLVYAARGNENTYKITSKWQKKR